MYYSFIVCPDTHQIPFLRKLINQVKETRIGELIICGDFNVVIARTLDRSAGSRRFAQELHSLVAEEELHDVWRYLHANERDYTYYSTSNKTHS